MKPRDERFTTPPAWALQRTCRRCHEPLLPGQVVLVEYDEAVQIEHETCQEDE
jgi:RNase P subunit RPR2